MNNLDIWRSAIILKKLFDERYDANEFNFLLKEKYPNLDEFRFASWKSDIESSFEDIAPVLASYSKDEELKEAHRVINSASTSEVTSVSVFKDVLVNPFELRSYLDEHHILDSNSCGDYSKAYSLRVGYKYIAIENFTGQNSWIKYVDDVVISTSFKFLIENLQNAIDIVSKNLRPGLGKIGDLQSIAIIRGIDVLYEMPIKCLSQSNILDPMKFVPDFEGIVVNEPTINEIRAFGNLLSPDQARRARAKVLEDDLSIS